MAERTRRPRTRPHAGLPIWLGATVFGLLLLLLIVPLPSSGRAMGAALDLCHAPAFAALTVGAFALLRRRRQVAGNERLGLLFAAWLLAVCVGLLSERMQAMTGRHTSLQDGIANLLGATAGLVGVACRFVAPLYRAIGWGAACILLVIAWLPPMATLADVYLQRMEFPVLASFEHYFELRRWKPINSRLARTTSDPPHGSYALRVDLEPGRFSGVTLDCPPANWSEKSTLLFNIRLDPGESLDLTAKIEDAQHSGGPDDRFVQTFCLQPGWQRLSIPLEAVAAAPRGRRLGLSCVSKLEFFTSNCTSCRVLELDNVHLR